MEAYRTIAVTAPELAAHYEIQKSKFITHLQHVESEDEARAFVTAMKKKYYDARRAGRHGGESHPRSHQTESAH